MHIFPAIDLFGGKAVRLYKGDYQQMTVYHEHPEEVAKQMESQGAKFLHLVDLEGARSGETSQLSVVQSIVEQSGLFVEVGGGIRTLETMERYIDIGVSRVILGTAAVQDPELVRRAVERFGDKIAVGADIKNGEVAIKGWTESSGCTLEDFCRRMEQIGVTTVICTDVSKDGAMQGTNRALYGELSKTCGMQIIASGGVSSMEDIRALAAMDIYGAIIGKAYYTGAIDLKEAIEVAG